MFASRKSLARAVVVPSVRNICFQTSTEKIIAWAINDGLVQAFPSENFAIFDGFHEFRSRVAAIGDLYFRYPLCCYSTDWSGFDIFPTTSLV